VDGYRHDDNRTSERYQNRVYEMSAPMQNPVLRWCMVDNDCEGNLHHELCKILVENIQFIQCSDLENEASIKVDNARCMRSRQCAELKAQ
jgi:hypothetical protein